MSRSLSRIRSLISEIEDIQRQGQQGGKSSWERTENLRSVPEVAQPVGVSASHRKPVLTEAEQDPFESLASVVDFDQKQQNKELNTEVAGKVYMQLSGQVILSLQIENSNELVELKQVGEALEIRFADGKAVHLPFKAVI